MDRTFVNTHSEVGAGAREGIQRAWDLGMEKSTFNLSSSALNSVTTGKLAHLSTQF